jgi:hypothetical protein
MISVPLGFLLHYLVDWGMWSIYLAMGVSNVTALAISWFWGKRTLQDLRFQAVAPNRQIHRLQGTVWAHGTLFRRHHCINATTGLIS